MLSCIRYDLIVNHRLGSGIINIPWMVFIVVYFPDSLETASSISFFRDGLPEATSGNFEKGK